MKKNNAGGRKHRAVTEASTAARKVKRLHRHLKMHGSDGQAINAADIASRIK